MKIKQFIPLTLLVTLCLTACISEVKENTRLSIKQSKKIEKITLITKTNDRALDPNAGLVKQNYYRTMLNRLESDIKSAGINVEEIQFKADETSLDPASDFDKLVEQKNIKNKLFIDAINITKSGGYGSIYGMGYNIVLTVVDDNKKQLFDGSQAVSQTVDLGTEGKMRDLGDKIFVSIKPALGIE